MAIENKFAEEEKDDKAADGAENAEGEGEKGGFSAKKIVLFIVLPLFILIGAGTGLYFTGTLDKLLKKGEATEEAADNGHGEKKEEKSGHGEKKKSGGHGEESEGGVAGAHFLPIPDITVNLNDTGGTQRYLRLKVQLELASDADLKAVEGVMPRVVDQFQTYLRELRVKDLRGSAGIYRLQMELLTRVNAAAYPVEVKDVLFQEILIQ